MDKKIMIPIIGGITLLVGLFVLFGLHNTDNVQTSKLEATVLSRDSSTVMVQDKDNVIYTFEVNDTATCSNGNVVLEYTGILNKNMEYQDVSVINCDTMPTVSENGVPSDWQDNGIFSNYYTLAYNKMKELTLDEKIAQVMLVRYPNSNQIEELKKYQFGGYLFFAKDFSGKTKTEVKKMISDVQAVANIPLLTAVDEEGGKVVRVSSNSNLADEEFAAPSSLYADGGFPLIREDTIKKSTLLKSLGLNLNLAPVVDVATDNDAYMYDRTLQQNTALTATYAETVIKASKGTDVSYTLKHFPGYGNNTDTHVSSATDTRSYDDILANDLPPFEAGIDVGAEAVLVSHNIVNSIDASNPASLSPSVHNLLRNQLDFTGIIISDDLDMGAVNSTDDVAVKAIMAGNDLIISTNYETDIKAIKSAINNGTLSEEAIEKLATRVIAWKYYKGLLFENQK
ncbi:MAG: beta-hexosaminidase [Bacilli bacterium]|nr:beta-hexosaminidase [Bacilli bacterium]